MIRRPSTEGRPQPRPTENQTGDKQSGNQQGADDDDEEICLREGEPKRRGTVYENPYGYESARYQPESRRT